MLDAETEVHSCLVMGVDVVMALGVGVQLCGGMICFFSMFCFVAAYCGFSLCCSVLGPSVACEICSLTQ